MKHQLLTDYTILLCRYIFGSLPPDEKEKLERHVDESDELMYVFEEATDARNYKKGAEFLDKIDLKAAYARVKAKGKGRMKFKVTASAGVGFPATIIQLNKWPKLYKYAVGLIMAALAIFFVTINRGKAPATLVDNSTTPTQNSNTDQQVTDQAVTPIAFTPGDSVINLKNIKEGEVVRNGDFIASMEKGLLSCSVNNSSGVGQSHTFITPTATTAKILLPDASSVALNALSSIKIIAASGGVLRVILSGEAFIESSSAPSSHLFLEVKDRMTIEVAKETHLNINAYPDEATIFTSVLKGNGDSKITAGSKTALLKYNQQARFRGDSLTIVNMNAVAADVTMAWKEGMFDFSYNFETMMRQVARWYDLDIVYVNDVIPVRTFSAKLSRDTNNLTDMINALRLNGLDIKQEGRKLIIAGELASK